MFIVTWYDQGTAANHATQPTAGSQARIVNAGVLDVQNTKAAGYWAAAKSAPAGFSGSPTARSVRGVSAIRNASNGELVRSSATGGFNPRFDGARTYSLLKQSASTIGTSGAGPAVLTLATFGADYTTTTYAFSVNGAANGSGSHTTTFTTALTGALGGGSSNSIDMAELLIFDAVISGGDSTAIQNNQKTYWGAA